jgi:hypothetical protein
MREFADPPTNRLRLMLGGDAEKGRYRDKLRIIQANARPRAFLMCFANRSNELLGSGLRRRQPSIQITR